MRLRQLDILRALAVLLVLGRHLPDIPASTGGMTRGILELWQRCGWIGVDLFFVLSGFLIAGLLFSEHDRHGRIALKRFYVRRGLKIYPPFYVLLLATLLINPLLELSLWPRTVAYEALFIQNYGPGLWVHTWSLAVEEHFYIVLPIALVLIARRAAGDGQTRPVRETFAPLVWLMPAVGIALLGMRLANVTQPFSIRSHMFPTHLRIDGLFFGVLLSYIYHAYPQALGAWIARHRRGVAIGSLLCVLPPLVWKTHQPLIHTVGFTLLYVGFGGILLLALDRERRGLPTSRAGDWLAKMGGYSYSIYLWHVPLLIWGGLTVGRSLPFGVWLAVYLVGSLVVGVAMARVIELPTLALRDRLFPSRSRPIATLSKTPTPVTPSTVAEAA